MTALYHRTCSHRIEQILADGFLQPNVQPMLGIRALWLTHAPWASREALALSSHTLSCDRMEYLLEVIEPVNVVRWQQLRPSLDLAAVRHLEAARGARPELWWVTGVTQRVQLASAKALR